MALKRPGPYVGLSAHYAYDEKIMEAGEDAELLYLRMLAYAARTPLTEGWISDAVLRSRLGILPRDAYDVTGNVTGTVPGTDPVGRVERLREVGLVTRDGTGWRIVSWLRWNRSIEEMGKERTRDTQRKGALTSNDPEPDRETARETIRETATTPGSNDQDQDQDQDQGLSPDPATPSQADEKFEEFWDIYAKKVGRKKAEEKWRRALRKPGVTPELLIQAASTYVTSQKAGGKHPEFTKDPSTWLSGEHWNDEPPARPSNVHDMPGRPSKPRMSDYTNTEWQALPIEERARIAERTTSGHLS